MLCYVQLSICIINTFVDIYIRSCISKDKCGFEFMQYYVKHRYSSTFYYVEKIFSDKSNNLIYFS